MCIATAIYHMFRPSKLRSSKPRPVRRYLSLIVLLVTFATLLVIFTRPFPTLPPPLPQCENAVVFTGARQGSTWFIDSIENCAYSTFVESGNGTRRFADDVFKKTELWKHFGEAHHGKDMSPQDALNYIVANTSIKIFPSVFWRRREDMKTILNEREKYNLTVLILRRDVEAAWDSWVRAESSDVWNGAVKTTNVTFNESLHKYFVESRERYDIAVETMLKQLEVAYDIFDYDEAKRLEFIVAKNNGCVIKNCNFRSTNRAVDYRVVGVEGGDGSVNEDAAGEDSAVSVGAAMSEDAAGDNAS